MSEIGGEFHWYGIPSGPFLGWPKPHHFFSTGRAALVSIARLHNRNRIWLPSYFCPHTAHYWRSADIDIVHYKDHPLDDHPDYSSLDPVPGDMVLVLNIFGVRSSKPWCEWQTKTATGRDILLIEDHSHDPLSDWARESVADYVFSSLRKTLPVPDGAIVWSPQGHELPPEPKCQVWNGSAKKLVAMLWKKEYLDGKEGNKQLKTFFRQLQVEGEADIEQNPNQQITPWSRRLLSPGIPLKWRKQREINVLRLIDRFPVSTRFSSLFTSWPTGSSPFNFIVLAASSAERDSLRSYLINHMIFTPIHWSLPDNSRSEDLELSRRLLTIPVDFRCSISEVDRIADIINAYVAQS